MERKAQPAKTRKQIVVGKATPVVWGGKDYTHIPEGTYTLRCTKIDGPDWVWAFKRWCLRLEFEDVMEPNGPLSMFFAVGKNPDHPEFGRQSKFFKAWVVANQGQFPAKGEEMGWDIFLDKIFEARVHDKEHGQYSEVESLTKVTLVDLRNTLASIDRVIG